jgi:ABC-type antimicrobial peptide transport system permease subunit
MAIASARLFSGMLYGVSSLDGKTFAGVIALVVLVAGSAAFVPAFRASRTDPMNVLREE